MLQMLKFQLPRMQPNLKQSDKRQKVAFEMWIYRRMISISWPQIYTNDSIQQKLHIETCLASQINKMYLKYFSHIARNTDAME